MFSVASFRLKLVSNLKIKIAERGYEMKPIILICGILGVICGILLMLAGATRNDGGGNFLFGMLIVVFSAVALIIRKVFDR